MVIRLGVKTNPNSRKKDGYIYNNPEALKLLRQAEKILMILLRLWHIKVLMQLVIHDVLIPVRNLKINAMSGKKMPLTQNKQFCHLTKLSSYTHSCDNSVRLRFVYI